MSGIRFIKWAAEHTSRWYTGKPNTIIKTLWISSQLFHIEYILFALRSVQMLHKCAFYAIICRAWKFCNSWQWFPQWVHARSWNSINVQRKCHFPCDIRNASAAATANEPKEEPSSTERATNWNFIYDYPKTTWFLDGFVVAIQTTLNNFCNRIKCAPSFQ